MRSPTASGSSSSAPPTNSYSATTTPIGSPSAPVNRSQYTQSNDNNYNKQQGGKAHLRSRHRSPVRYALTWHRAATCCRWPPRASSCHPYAATRRLLSPLCSKSPNRVPQYLGPYAPAVGSRHRRRRCSYVACLQATPRRSAHGAVSGVKCERKREAHLHGDIIVKGGCRSRRYRRAVVTRGGGALSHTKFTNQSCHHPHAIHNMLPRPQGTPSNCPAPTPCCRPVARPTSRSHQHATPSQYHPG